MTIRRATREDRRAVLRMAFAFYEAGGYRGMFGEPSQLAALVDQVIAGEPVPGVVLLAERVGDICPPAGMLAAVVVPHPFSGRLFGEELALWIDPAFRGGVTWRRLERAYRAWAAEQGAQAVRMIQPAGSEIGRVYERLGYTAVEISYHKGL